MRPTSSSQRATTLGALLVAVSACGPEPDAEPGPTLPPFSEPERCPGEATNAGALESRTIAVGTEDDDVFVPWADGQDATLVLGFQGGMMITPTVQVPSEPADGDVACWQVRIQNAVESDVEIVPGLLSNVVFERTGDLFRAGPFNNLLGLDPEPLRGQLLVMTVTVTGSDFEGAQTLELYLR